MVFSFGCPSVHNRVVSSERIVRIISHTYENVNHEESNDDDINYVVSSNNGTKIMDGSFIFIM
jgi:hypothetical protein